MTRSDPQPLTSPDAGNDDSDLTIGTLRDSGRRLGLLCHHCHRFRYLRESRFDDGTRLRDIAQGLTCARCGSDDVEILAIARDPATGYWPAERS